VHFDAEQASHSGGGGLAVAGWPASLSAQGGKIDLVFAGNELCGQCKIWRAQSEPGFKSSPAFKKLTYHVVHPANATLMLKEENWPAGIRWILTDFQMSDEGAQRGGITPRFILAQN